MDNIFADFLLNSGLYDETPITQDNIEQLFELIEGKVKIDAYCKDCGEKRVFSVEPIYYTTERGEKTIELSLGDTLRKTKNMCLMQLNPRPGESESNGNWQFYWFTQDLEKDTRIMCFSFVCAMHDWHHLDYIVLTNNTTMKKIGQYPSVADLAFPELDEYKKSLTKEDLRELRRAIGLYSQNIGVGSFVYLRRILERLIEKTREMATDSIDANAYAQSKIVDRIKMLKDCLPKFLVDNATLYSIISKGIHELTEDECLQYFPILKDAIIMIASKWEQERKLKESEEALSKSISKIYQTLK